MGEQIFFARFAGKFCARFACNPFQEKICITSNLVTAPGHKFVNLGLIIALQTRYLSKKVPYERSIIVRGVQRISG